MDSYGIMMDKGMIQNIIETDSREVYELFSARLFLYFFFFGVLPSMVIWRVKINYRKYIRSMAFISGVILLSLDQDAFIVLHQKGSHGPAYYLRYPDSFKVFEPVCSTSQLDQCPRQEIINAYDNTILYTDYFLSRVIDFLKTNSDRFYTAMIYVSDHGESLGEDNIYLHGLPYHFAPDDQIHVPFIVWFSKEFEESYNIDRIRLHAISAERHSHDDLFASILGLLDIRTAAYDPRMDLFAPAKSY